VTAAAGGQQPQWLLNAKLRPPAIQESWYPTSLAGLQDAQARPSYVTVAVKATVGSRDSTSVPGSRCLSFQAGALERLLLRLCPEDGKVIQAGQFARERGQQPYQTASESQFCKIIRKKSYKRNTRNIMDNKCSSTCRPGPFPPGWCPVASQAQPVSRRGGGTPDKAATQGSQPCTTQTISKVRSDVGAAMCCAVLWQAALLWLGVLCCAVSCCASSTCLVVLCSSTGRCAMVRSNALCCSVAYHNLVIGAKLCT
jgi:hypothetical protein